MVCGLEFQEMPRIVQVQQENHRAQLQRVVRKDLWFVWIRILSRELLLRRCETVHDNTLRTLQVLLGPFFEILFLREQLA